MYATTPEFTAALSEPHRIVTRLDLIEAGKVVQTLPLSGGKVDVEADAATRRKCDLVIPLEAESDLRPLGQIGDKIHAYGVEVMPWRGIRFPDGTEEMKPLGIFNITEIDPDEEGHTLTLKGMDRSTKAVKALTRPLGFWRGTSGDVVIHRILRAVDPTATFLAPDDLDGSAGPMIFPHGKEALAEARGKAQSMGYTLYVDVLGRYVLAPAPGAFGNTPPVAKFVTGRGGIKIDGKRTYSTIDRPFNGVIVTGAAVRGGQVRAEIWDENQEALTYYKGPYGRNPEVIDDDKITTYGDAYRQARSRLQLHLGKGEEVQITAVPHAGLDGDDPVLIEQDDIMRTYFIHSMTIPLEPKDPMTLVGRRGVFNDAADLGST